MSAEGVPLPLQRLVRAARVIAASIAGSPSSRTRIFLHHSIACRTKSRFGWRASPCPLPRARGRWTSMPIANGRKASGNSRRWRTTSLGMRRAGGVSVERGEIRGYTQQTASSPGAEPHRCRLSPERDHRRSRHANDPRPGNRGPSDVRRRYARQFGAEL